MSRGGNVEAGGAAGLPPSQPPAKEVRGINNYCIRCRQNFKTVGEKVDHDRTVHGY